MKIIYTKHAEEKLRRVDIKKFGISKKLIQSYLKQARYSKKTKLGDYYTICILDKDHDLRIIYDIIDRGIKVITFHIARKGRYK